MTEPAPAVIECDNGVRLGHYHNPRGLYDLPFVSVLGFGQPLSEDPVAHRVNTQHTYSVDLRGARFARHIFERPILLIDDYVEALCGALEQQGIEYPLVEGQSWGAAIAQRLAVEQPDLCSGLVLTSGSTGVGSVEVTPEAFAFLTKPGERARLAYDIFGDERLRAGSLAEDELNNLIQTTYEDNPGNVLQSLALMQAARLLASRTNEIRVPTVVVSGTHDRLVPHKDSHALSVAIPDATFVPVEGAGHLLRLHPDAVATAINGLLHAAATRRAYLQRTHTTVPTSAVAS